MTIAYVPRYTPGAVAGLLIIEADQSRLTTHTNSRTGPNVIEVRDEHERVAKFVITRHRDAGSHVSLFPGIYRPLAARRLYQHLLKSLAYTRPSGLI